MDMHIMKLGVELMGYGLGTVFLTLLTFFAMVKIFAAVAKKAK